MKKATLLLILTALFPIASCDLADVDASEVGRELRQVLQELSDAGEDMRDEVVDAAEEARTEFQGALSELKKELAENEELRRELEERQAQLAELIDEVKDGGEVAWAATRDTLLDAIDEIRQAIDELQRGLGN